MTMDESIMVENDLLRVFRFLCGYSSRTKLRRLEREYQTKQTYLMTHAANVTSSVPAEWSKFPSDAYEIMEVLGEGETEKLDALKREILILQHDADIAKGEGTISIHNLSNMLKDMHLQLSKLEIEHMIWEVDENLDGVVSYDEFKTMFTRCADDIHGLEPSQLYHIVQYLVYDHNMNFQVTVGEIAQRSRVRHNSVLLNEQLTLLFGKEHPESIVSLSAYWNIVNTNLPKMFGV